MPCPPGLAVAELVPAEHEVAGIADGLLRSALAVGQRGERHVGLEGGAWRVGAGERAVDERLVGRVVELVPVQGIDAVDEEIGVEARLAHEREHAARGWIDRDQRAAPVAERGVGDLLQACVEVEHDVVAGHGRRARERPHRAPARVDLDLLHAGGAVQIALVVLLEPGLADVVGAAVVGGEALGLELLDLALVDAADVAHHVREQLALRVLAEQPRVDLHAGEAVADRREARDLLVGEARAHRQAADALALLEQPLEAPPVARA